ncbi:putative vesicular glutamate transporter eat-4 [Aphelenchoides fujianensis]|nr:putative vesicular glutamate transporter eat-4 [Aphelenchoides fujianensis]
MAAQIPTTLQGVQSRFVDGSKQIFNDYGQPISKFFNSGSGASNEHEMTKMNENSGSAVLDGATITREDGLHVHANVILKTVDSIGWMRCSRRWQLAALANIGFMIVFGIRCNFGAAKNYMGRDYVDPWGKKHHGEFNWTRAELGVMESSFFYGYLVTQVPAGFLAAKFPANKMFGIAIGGAAVLNILLPYAFRSRSDGMGYPAMHGVWRHWAPPLERSKLATTAFAGSYAGAVFGLPLSAWLVSYVGWSTPFYTYGVLGVIWAVLWFSLTFEKPAYHPTISNEEKTYIEDQIGHVSHTVPSFTTIPWKAILTSKPVYAIINQLTYMRDVLGMKINDSGVPAALPHAVMGIVVVAGGQLADNLRSSGRMSTTLVRKVFNCGGFGGEAFFMLFVAYTRSERVALIRWFSPGFAISGFNVNHLDIAPRYAAILMGFSNGIGTLAGLTCPFVTEILTAKGPHGWVTVFLLASLIHFTGVTFYAIYAFRRPAGLGRTQRRGGPVEGGQERYTTKPQPPGGNVSYGAAGEQSIQLAPLPDITDIHANVPANNSSRCTAKVPMYYGGGNQTYSISNGNYQ